MPILQCEKCGKSFNRFNCWIRKAKHYFCSRECQRAWQTLYPTRHCAACGKGFRTCGKGRKFCSLKCAYGNRSGDRKKGNTTSCQTCGKAIYTEARHASRGVGRHCSAKCREKRAIRKCEVCDKLFTIKASEVRLDGRGRFCSFGCYRRSCGLATSIEKKIADAMHKARIQFKEQVQIGRYSVDFLIGKTVVEADGDYWHSLDRTTMSDARRDSKLRALGYKVVRLSEAQIKNNIGSCIKQIEKVVK